MIKRVFMMLLICGILVLLPISVYAEEDKTVITELNILMIVTEKVDALEKPVVGSKVMFSFAKGDSVMVAGETADGWYQVTFQGKVGYLSKDKLTDSGIDTEALLQEREDAEMTDKLFIEEVERLRAEQRRSRIWGAVIVLLVVAIFALGIISAIKAKKGEEEQGKQPSVEKKAGRHEKEEVAQSKTPDLDIIDMNNDVDLTDLK